MDVLFRILAMVILTVIICYLIKKLVESIFNLITLWETRKHPGRYPERFNRGGMVFNKKTRKLEADNHIKQPF
jgi:hypothetical protein